MNIRPKSMDQYNTELGLKLLGYISEELYVALPYLRPAIYAYTYCKCDSPLNFATDGDILNYPAQHYLQVFKENDKFLIRAYLHVMLHCLYGHLWVEPDALKRVKSSQVSGELDNNGAFHKSVWHLACDVAVEMVIDSLTHPLFKRPLTYSRTVLYKVLKENGIRSAAQIYDWLLYERDTQDRNLAIETLMQEFYTDSHHLWPDETQLKMPQIMAKKNKWQDIADSIEKSVNRDQNASTDADLKTVMESASVRNQRRSLRDFLLKFTKLKEVPSVNEDELDLGLYELGFKLYQNTPIIEPTETAEIRRISNLAIVIDTSFSTEGEPVKKFLEESLGFLLEENVYHSRSRVHLIQCDDKVTSHQVIDDVKKAKYIFSSIRLTGGGNTDFRPAFELACELKVDGLIYLTDGRGIYPKSKMPFPTAFILSQGADKSSLPAWAMSFCLTE